jgi:hypothetical protein
MSHASDLQQLISISKTKSGFVRCSCQDPLSYQCRRQHGYSCWTLYAHRRSKTAWTSVSLEVLHDVVGIGDSWG